MKPSIESTVPSLSSISFPFNNGLHHCLNDKYVIMYQPGHRNPRPHSHSLLESLLSICIRSSHSQRKHLSQYFKKLKFIQLHFRTIQCSRIQKFYILLLLQCDSTLPRCLICVTDLYVSISSSEQSAHCCFIPARLYIVIVKSKRKYVKVGEETDIQCFEQLKLY